MDTRTTETFDALRDHADRHDGLTVQCDLRGVSREGLYELCRWSNRFRRRCPTLGEWLADVLIAEGQRRDSENSPEPLELPLPEFAAHRLDNEELGAALQSLQFSDWLCRDETARRFIRKTLMTVVAVVKYTLRKV